MDSHLFEEEEADELDKLKDQASLWQRAETLANDEERTHPSSRLAKPVSDSGAMAEMPIHLNSQLVDSTRKLNAELALLQSRIDKMESHRAQVAQSVYDKVKADYLKQLKEVTAHFNHKREEVEVELEKLYSMTRDTTQVLNRHRETLEEAKFRHFLGEYADQKYKAIEKKEEKEIYKYERVLEQLEEYIHEYESLIATPEKSTENKEKKEEPTRVSVPVYMALPKPDEMTPTTSQQEDSIANILSTISHELDSSLSVEEVKEPVAAPAKLVLVDAGGEPATFVETPIEGTMVIGRLPTNHIALPSSKVSRKHAEMMLRDGDYVIVDLESSNGVYVNGNRVKESVLKNGDDITIGRYKFRFEVRA